jgi:carboxyl-terminal processing protease
MTPRIVAGLILSVASAAGAQTPDQTARLATLGQAWGFLKYFHPRVATGTINWDSALVAAIPAVKTSRDNAQLNAVIQSWLDGLGDVTPCADVSCFRVVPDSMRKNLDLRWITDGKTLTPELVRRLSRLRDAPHQGSGRYVTFRGTAMFEKDTAFSAPEYPSEEVRILSLFRFWNAARYFFPYMYVNDGDWAAVLREFIPRMIAAKDDSEYHLADVEMTSRVNDAHVGASSAVTNRVFGMRFPAFEARSIDGRLVVWRLTTGAPTDGSGVQVGDVITHIDGEAVSQRRRDHTKYIAAGNPLVFERKLASQTLRSQNDSAT